MRNRSDWTAAKFSLVNGAGFAPHDKSGSASERRDKLAKSGFVPVSNEVADWGEFWLVGKVVVFSVDEWRFNGLLMDLSVDSSGSSRTDFLLKTLDHTQSVSSCLPGKCRIGA